MKDPIRIIITEDKPQWRKALRLALQEHNIVTIAEAQNGQELIEQLALHTPDVILLDLRMPVMDGNAAMQWLSEYRPGLKVIVISYYDEPSLMDDYITRGAKGYMIKEEAADTDELVAAIYKVHKGGTYMNYERHRAKKYKPREKEIIHLVAEGQSVKEMAQTLNITTSGIDKQKKKIMEKMGVKTFAKLSIQIVRQGLNFIGRPPRNNRPTGS